MGQTETENTVLRGIFGSRKEGKTGAYSKFHIEKPHWVDQIVETEVEDEKFNKTSVETAKRLLCPFKYKIQLNAI
jgi:hypothetical protein